MVRVVREVREVRGQVARGPEDRHPVVAGAPAVHDSLFLAQGHVRVVPVAEAHGAVPAGVLPAARVGGVAAAKSSSRWTSPRTRPRMRRSPTVR